MINPTTKEVIKFLRDRLVRIIDQAGEDMIYFDEPSSNAYEDLGPAYKLYEDAVVRKTVSLDTLTEMERAKADKHG